MRAILIIALLACAPYTPDPTDPAVLPVDWRGGIYGLALADGGIGPAILDDGGQAPGDLVPVPCGYGGTLTGPAQLYGEGVWTDLGRVVKGQYEWCAGGFSGNDLSGTYGYGPQRDGFSASLVEGMRGGLGVYDGHVSPTEIRATVAGLGLDGYLFRLAVKP